jgi:hypothetical protein
MDAARFRLRDSLRAQALASLFPEFNSVYVETGTIHYTLWQYLRTKLDVSIRMKLLFVADGADHDASRRMYRYGPGDRLTLLYMFHPAFSDRHRENLLAARSLIYAKLIAKNEMTEDLKAWPHIRNEMECILFTNRLSLNECRDLYDRVRHSDTQQAHQIAAAYSSG